MNVPSQAESGNSQPRRVSNPSGEVDGLADNPLMKLVDAASMLQQPVRTPGDAPKVDAKADVTDVTITTESTNATEESCCSSLASEEQKPDVSEAPSSNKGKVVLGTKADLFNTSHRKPTFPEELMAILDDEANSDVLVWKEDGESFTIVNHRLFALDRMPKLFNIRNMSSFVRKLTRWGFSRVHEKATRNSDIFKHDLFKRGRKDLVRKIRCVYRPLVKADSTFPTLVSPVTEEIRNTGHEYAMPSTPSQSRGMIRPQLIQQSPGFRRSIAPADYQSPHFSPALTRAVSGGSSRHIVKPTPVLQRRVVSHDSQQSLLAMQPRAMTSSPRYSRVSHVADIRSPSYVGPQVSAALDAMHHETSVSAQLNRDLLAIRAAREQAIRRAMVHSQPHGHPQLGQHEQQNHSQMPTSPGLRSGNRALHPCQTGWSQHHQHF